MIIYQFQLDVYKTTCEPDYFGGNFTITKDFVLKSDALDWFKRYNSEFEFDDIITWINDNNFPQILDFGNSRVIKIEISEELLCEIGNPNPVL